MLKQSRVLGLMSGTSLDGLDICYAIFNQTEKGYTYKIIQAESFSYSIEWREKLDKAMDLNNNELAKLDIEYGIYTAKMINLFLSKYNLLGQVDLIGSHGQTVFHEPSNGVSVQIGAGQEIANLTQLPLINNFRIKDVLLGGQGAPLVPIGDRYLFGEYESCLNLGGIANISLEEKGERIAFDICPANLPLNKICRDFLGLEYDKDGVVAKEGKVVSEIVGLLDGLKFYSEKHPKSLGVEWLNKNFYPVLDSFNTLPKPDLLRSIIEHECNQIAFVLQKFKIGSVLITGGGAFNSFFIETLQAKTSTKIDIPSSQIIEFKEALIFGFIAFLNSINQLNTLKSVTGASKDSIGGVRCYPSN